MLRKLLLAICGAVLIFTWAANAQNPVGGNFHGIHYRAEITDFDWTVNDSFSRHAVYAHNRNAPGEIIGHRVDWRWIHKLKRIGSGGWFDSSEIGKTVWLGRGEKLDKVGWLTVDLTWKVDGTYKIVAFTEIIIDVVGESKETFLAEDESATFVID